MKVNIAIRLWNKTINMNRKLNMNTIAICRKNMNENYIDNIESLVRQIVFNVIFLYHGRWKEDNYWQYLDITSSTLKAWLGIHKAKKREKVNRVLTVISRL
ncbi:hypothetical protein AB4K20DRAFT_1905459 [Rhizopus microsporus]